MNTTITIFALLTLLVGITSFAAETATQVSPADGQSAVQVPATAPTATPSFFLGYNYFHYDLEGQSTANTNIYKFGAASVDYHLVTATWLYSSDWTLLVMVPYIRNAVETIYEPVTGGLNMSLTDHTKGLGDVRLMAVSPVSLDPAHMVMADLSVTVPTGSIDELFETSTAGQRASYNMQLGSGTPDVLVGATLTNSAGKLVSTARGQVTVRNGKNKNHWAHGNELSTNFTSTYNVNSYVGLGATANYKIRGAVVGKDEQYEKFNSWKTAASEGNGHQYYHGSQMNWDANLVAKLKTPAVSMVSAAFEVGVPVAQGFQNKDDIKLETNYWAAGTVTASF